MGQQRALSRVGNLLGSNVGSRQTNDARLAAAAVELEAENAGVHCHRELVIAMWSGRQAQNGGVVEDDVLALLLEIGRKGLMHLPIRLGVRLGASGACAVELESACAVSTGFLLFQKSKIKNCARRNFTGETLG